MTKLKKLIQKDTGKSVYQEATIPLQASNTARKTETISARHIVLPHCLATAAGPIIKEKVKRIPVT